MKYSNKIRFLIFFIYIKQFIIYNVLHYFLLLGCFSFVDKSDKLPNDDMEITESNDDFDD